MVENVNRQENNTSLKKVGDQPRSIRTRGFHRAVKRREGWALKIWDQRDKNPLAYIYGLTYRNYDFSGLIYKDNPFLSLIPKTESFHGNYSPVPIERPKK
jgi:hypothetical protein